MRRRAAGAQAAAPVHAPDGPRATTARLLLPQVLGTGSGVYTPSRDFELLNFGAPILRDTATVPPSGWMLIRFRANNPGLWPLHCHILWHSFMGQQVRGETLACWQKNARQESRLPLKCPHSSPHHPDSKPAAAPGPRDSSSKQANPPFSPQVLQFLPLPHPYIPQVVLAEAMGHVPKRAERAAACPTSCRSSFAGYSRSWVAATYNASKYPLPN